MLQHGIKDRNYKNTSATYFFTSKLIKSTQTYRHMHCDNRSKEALSHA